MNKMTLSLVLLSIAQTVAAQVQQPADSTRMESTKLNEVNISLHKQKYKVANPSNSLRLNTSLLKTPQNIQVITPELLADQQIFSMADGITRNISGAVRLEHWGDLYARINMRGFRAAAFLNGVNVTTSWGPLSEDMSYVDRIEVVKGPAGFMMSNSDPSGLYNVVTKKPTGKELNGHVSTTLGSFNFYRLEADVDTKLSDKVAFRLNLMGQNKKTHRPFEFNNRYVFAPSLRFQLTDRTILTTEYTYQQVQMSDVGGNYIFAVDGYDQRYKSTVINDPGLEPTQVKDHMLNVNLQHQLNDDWKMTAQLTYINNRQIGSSLWLMGKPTANNRLIRTVGMWDALIEQKYGQLFLNGKVETGAVTHKILTGLDMADKYFIADWSQNFQLDTKDKMFDLNHPVYGQPFSNAENIIPFDRSVALKQRPTAGVTGTTYTGFYVQDELGFFEDVLRLTLAARYTQVENYNRGGKQYSSSKVSPRVGLSVSIDESLSLYGLYDQSFTPQNGLLRDEQTVKPITGNNFEVGVKKEWIDGKFSTGLSAYQILRKNALTGDPDSPVGQVPAFSLVVDESRVKGIEFDAKGEVVKGLNVMLNYAYTENYITKSQSPKLRAGNRNSGYSKHAINGWATYNLPEGFLEDFGLSAGFTFLGDRSSFNWNGDGSQQNMDDYFKTDAGLFWSSGNTKINLNVFNVFNRFLYSGSPSGNYYSYQVEAPRNVRMSIVYNF